MTIFDQRNQTVTYQYNLAGDINFGAVSNHAEVMTQLDKLQTELNTAVEAGVFNEGDATDVKYQLTKAVQQARKPEADKKSILDHLGRAREIVGGVSKTMTSANGLFTALGQAAEMVQKFF